MKRQPARQFDIPLEDFALTAERIYSEPSFQTKTVRAVDLPGPTPPADLVAPIQEELL